MSTNIFDKDHNFLLDGLLNEVNDSSAQEVQGVTRI